MMKIEKEIALKYLRPSSGGRAVTVMAIISIIGIAMGVAALLVSYSIAGGFKEAYEKAILNFNSHVILMSPQEIEDYDAVVKKVREFAPDEVKEVNPFLWREGLLIYNGKIRGIVLKGTTHPVPSIMIGSFLAKEMGISDGDTVKIMFPAGREDETGNFTEFSVAGVFESGMYEFDSQFALMGIKELQDIFNAENVVSGIEIKLNDPETAPAFARRLEGVLDYPIYATDWQEMNAYLFQAMRLEKLGFIIIMGTFVVVAAFNIIGTIVLRILYKSSDISIMRALGMRARSVTKVFTAQGLAIGTVGTLAGVGAAAILLWSIKRFNWIDIPEEIYLIKTLPVCISWTAGILIAAFSILVSYVTSVIASAKAAELPIVKGLHRP